MTTKAETKKEKFNRIIPTRLNNFKLATERLAKLGNKYCFDYSEEDKKRIMEYVSHEIDMLKQQFNSPNFKFKENGK